MARSSGFGSANSDKRSCKARFHCGFSILYFNLPLPASRWLILQHAHSQTISRSPTVCKLMVSCSISLPLRGSFHLSLTVLFTIGHLVIFSLTRWSSQIHTGFHVSHATWDLALSILDFQLQDFHLLRYSIPTISLNLFYLLIFVVPRPHSNVFEWFRLFPFRSPLLRESLLLSFPPATKMFQFTRFVLYSLLIQLLVFKSCLIRAPPDHSLLPAPRSISSVATPFITSKCQGIHHKPLFA